MNGCVGGADPAHPRARHDRAAGALVHGINDNGPLRRLKLMAEKTSSVRHKFWPDFVAKLLADAPPLRHPSSPAHPPKSARAW